MTILSLLALGKRLLVLRELLSMLRGAVADTLESGSWCSVGQLLMPLKAALDAPWRAF